MDAKAENVKAFQLNQSYISVSAMDIDSEIFCMVNHYVRLNLYGSAARLCDESARRVDDQRQLNILKAYCFAKAGKSAEAIRLLNNYMNESDLDLAVFTALKIAYTNEKTVDKDSIREMDMKIQAAWATSHDRAAFLTGTLLMFEKTFDRARSLIERTANSNTHNSTCVAQKGWLELLTGRDSKAAMTNFENAIASKCPEAYLGKARHLEMRHDLNAMKTTVNELITEHPTLLAGYIELIKVLAMSRDWEAMAEAAQNASLIQHECIPVQLFECIECIVIKGDLDTAETLLPELFDTVIKTEATNHDLCLYIGKFLSAVMLDHSLILQFAKRFIDRALLNNNNSIEAIAEKSRLLLLENDVKQAMKTAISAVDEQNLSSPTALLCIIRCYIAQNEVADAKTQMDLLKATFPEVDKTVECLFLQTMINRLSGVNNEQFLFNIKNIVDHQLANLQSTSYGLDFLKQLNATFLLELVSLLFEIAPITPSKIADPTLKEIERILTVICEHFPGAAKPAYLFARAKYLYMDVDGAQKLLQNCIDKNNNIAEAYLLMAQIFVHKQDLEEASKYLDIGLGFNFKVRDHPLYYLIKARVLKRSKKTEEAIMMLKSALDLPAFLSKKKKQKNNFGVLDREKSYEKLEQEAGRMMNSAIAMYHGKAEEHQLVLMNAQLRLQRGDVDGAIKVLENVQPDQLNYQMARVRMAQIYLEYKHDRIRFAQCYKDILDKNATPQAYVMLGDAYMSIQEATNAIDAYETAMRRNPKDFELAVKIGNAYVKCHLYNKAINFYESAMNSSKQPLLRLRFAEQLLRLGNFEKCERVLRDVIDESKDPSDLQELRDHVAFWSLLSRMHYEAENHSLAITAQQKARALQMKILGMSLSEITGVASERRSAAEICCRLAELHASRREWQKSIELYKEAIFINERELKMVSNPAPDSLEYFHLQTMIRLAHIYMTMGKLQQCNQQCQAIINLDKNNNEATLMLADLMYQRNEGDQALKHFAQLLERNPNHYHALARYIELGWRKGDLELVEKYIKNAYDCNPRATSDAGYNYCRGLIEWYSSEPNNALQAFNRARRDLEWGGRALYNMIEICLNPDNEIIGGEVVFENSDQIPLGENREIGVKTADRFLKELRHKPGLDYKYKLMENFILLTSGNKANVQQALTNFLEFAGTDTPGTTLNGDRNLNVGAILGSARAYMMLKQSQKAKAQLKRVLSHPWNLEDADYLQQCWLLLADMYINQGKNDQATAVLRTVLQYNASATKAFEYMGFLREREQKFADAAANYEMAWRLCRQRNAAIGYKLSYNYLKCRRLFDCIETCHVVLQQYPNYPKIKKDVLDKARASIRV
ncbi:Tetratricopeptide repeat protein 21B [Aphelenchoides besseyi]|nr:Tetratricopeptide repeat protein 21B [Aphelenchoides besseyi]KAI6201669.1 Tetratricopeptide repeat protein 21B [Aphelenchoides besseyi]